jgi:aminopeptidase C
MARHVGIWFFSDVNTISEKEKEIIYIEIYRIELKIEW